MIAGWIQALCAVLDTPAVPWHQVASALTTLEYVVHMYVLQRQAPLYERTQLPPALAPTQSWWVLGTSGALALAELCSAMEAPERPATGARTLRAELVVRDSCRRAPP